MMEVRGKQYRTGPTGTLQLHVLRRMKAMFGIGWGTVTKYMQGLDEQGMLADVVSDNEFQAWIWAWMANAGDVLTRAEFDALDMGDLNFREQQDEAEPADDDAGEAEDPTQASARTGSAPADANLEHAAGVPG